MRLQAFPVWICSLNLLQDKEAGFGRQLITPHASTLFSRLLLSSPVHTFRLSRLLWGTGEGKTDKAASTEITYHSLAMCSAPLSGKCWICQSGSTAGNMWAQFWGCRFKWVEHRSMGIRAHSLENLKQVMFRSFIYIFIRRITHSKK